MISEKLSQELVLEAKSAILSAKNIIVLTHTSPDGDAMGSSLALARYIRLLSPEAEVHNVIPTACPDFLRWMPGAADMLIYETQTAEVEALFASADLICCTDFAEVKRVGLMESFFSSLVTGPDALPSLVIDHHLCPQSFARPFLSLPSASSASELVFRLIDQLGDRSLIDLPLATCLYTGLMTDTGNFQYSSADPELYEIVAALIRTGINKDVIYDNVFNQFTVDRMRLMGFCLYNKMQILPGNVALITLSRKEQYMFNFQSGDAEGIVNLPLQIAEVKYSCLMREDKDKIKISFRSQGDRPVNVFAHEFFQGGGHKNASGGEFHGSLADSARRFLDHYSDYLNL